MNERVGAVVLAGGRSSRFGSDKLVAGLDGRPLLEHVLGAVRAVDPAIDVVVVSAPGVHRAVEPSVRVVADELAFGGPLAGLATGLAAIGPEIERVVVVGGDMPWLVPAVLGRMLAVLAADQTVEAVALDDDGRTRPLPLAVRRVPAARAAAMMLAADDRRLHRLLDHLATVVLSGTIWRSADPGGASLRDVDTPADLIRG